jgi:hypothetical protein
MKEINEWWEYQLSDRSSIQVIVVCGMPRLLTIYHFLYVLNRNRFATMAMAHWH